MSAQTSPSIPFIDSSLVQWFVCPELRQSSKYRAYKQQAVVLVALVLCCWGLFFGLLFYFAFDAPMLAIPTGLLAAFGIGTLSLIRFTRSTFWSGQIICLLAVLVPIWLALRTGGIASPSVPWLLLVPILANICFTKRRWTHLWTALIIAIAVGLYLVVTMDRGLTLFALSDWHQNLLYVISNIGLFVTVLSAFAIRYGIETWVLDMARREEADKRRAESELRRSHELAWKRSKDSFQGLIENSPEGVLVHRDRKVVYANTAFKKLAGYEDQSMEGLPLEKLTRTEDLETVNETIELLKSRDSIPAKNGHIRTQDGNLVPVEINAFRSTFNHIQVLISFVRDLSEKREMQSKMMQFDRMVAVGNLAAGVAHEINNPLSFVYSNIEFLLRRLSDDCDAPTFGELHTDQVRETLLDSLEGTDRIRSIVADLRTFSVDRQLTRTPMEIEATLESAIKLASNQIHQRAQLIRDYAHLPTIESDESGLAQVFMNMLVNAAQAIPEGAPEKNEIRISTGVQNQEIFIEFSDTGKGISRNNMECIFDPFFSTKSEQEEMGMGLGLSICLNIVQNLGGRIDVDSELGEGTTFRVVIPMQLTVEDSAEFEMPAQISSDAKGRLVIIDDEPRLLRAQERQLGEQFDITTFGSAADALEDMESNPSPRLILCDLQMPGMSGAGFYRRLEKTRPAYIERLVFISGGAFTEEIRFFLDEVDPPILKKPFSLTEVLNLLEDHKMLSKPG